MANGGPVGGSGGGGIRQLTGDVTAGPGSGSVAATLATVNANVGSFALATVTVNAKGLVTAVSAASTSGSGAVVLTTSPTIVTPTIASFVNATHNHQNAAGGGQLNASSVFSTGTLPAAQMPALTGDITTSAGAVATTLTTVNSNVGSFALATVTVNAKGLVTAASTASTTGSGNVVLATSPTITTPGIADLTNMTHSHQNAAGGGSLSAAAIGSGTLALARGGTSADLSATGGANQFVKQSSSGAALTVAAILSADLTSALTAPPAIGGTTPAAGTFAPLEVTGVAKIGTGGTNLNIYNPNTGFATPNFVNQNFHTIINGQIDGTDGGAGNIVIGGTITANTSGGIFNINIGYGNTFVDNVNGIIIGRSSSMSNAIGGIVIGNAAVNNFSSSIALGTSATTTASNQIMLGTASHTVVALGKIETPIIRPVTDSTTALKLTKADGSTAVVTVDTTNSRIGIGTTPTGLLEVLGTGDQLRVVHTATGTFGEMRFYEGSTLQAAITAYGSTAATFPNSFVIGSRTADTILATNNDTERLRVKTTTGYIGIGTGSTVSARLHVLDTDAVTAAVTNVAIFDHTGGTSAAGFGTGALWKGKSSSQSRELVDFQGLYNSPTDASYTTYGLLRAYYMNSGTPTARNAIGWGATGSAALIGFLAAAAAPVALQTTYTQTYTTTTSTVNPASTSAFTGQDNLQVGNSYAKVADLNTLRSDVLMAIQLINQQIDNGQAYGLAA